MNDIQSNRRIAINYIRELALGEIDESVCAPGWTNWDCGGGFIPRETFRAEMRHMISCFPEGFKMECLDTTAEENRVAIQVRSHGILNNGSVYENDYVFIFIFENGRISQVREFTDWKPIEDILLPAMAASRKPNVER